MMLRFNAQKHIFVKLAVLTGMIFLFAASGCGVQRPHVWVNELPLEDAAPTPYRISAGDSLLLTVWGQREISGVQTVRQDGNISVVLVGDVKVVGLTTHEASEQISKRLEGGIVQNVQVDITVQNIAPRFVTVVGEVGSTGKIELSSDDNLIDIIAKSGGFSEFAHTDQIYVLRAKSDMKVVRFDYDMLTSCPRGGVHFQLQDGDVIIVD